MDKPNIVIVMSDQQRWDTLGYRPLSVTPRLDQLAADGTRFEYAFTPQPLCGPARACIHTGMYASRTGCYANNIPLPPDADTLAKRLRAADYDTAYFGKWHLGSSGLEDHFRPTPPELRGGFLDRWQAVEVPEFTSNSTGGYLFDERGRRMTFTGYRTDAMTDLAIEYLEARADASRPFLLFLSFVEPHPQSYRRKHYNGPEISDRSDLLRDYIRYEGPDRYRGTFASVPPPEDLQAIPGDWEVSFADYLAACRGVDDNVGRILDALRISGRAQNTLTVFTSDHGNHFHTRNDNDGKCSCHDASIRIPLIVKGPGFGEGETRNEFASLIDIAPTALQAAGLSVPDGMDGEPLQSPPAKRDPFEAFVQIGRFDTGRALRTQDWTYAARTADDDPMGSAMYDSHLYHLPTDPHQLSNLVDDPRHANRTAHLRQPLTERISAIEQIDCRITEKT